MPRRPAKKSATPPVIPVVDVIPPQKKTLLYGGIATVMAIIVIGWLVMLPRLITPTTTEGTATENSDWQKSVDDFRTTFDQAKASLADISQLLKNPPAETTATDQPDVTLTPEQVEQLKTAFVTETTATWVTYSDFDHHFSFKYPADWQVTTPDDRSWKISNNTSTITMALAADVENPQSTGDLIITGSGTEYELFKTTITFIK